MAAAPPSPRDPHQDAIEALALLSLLVEQQQSREDEPDPGGDLKRDSWIHRYVERLEFLDDTASRRSITLVLEIPTETLGIATDELRYLPLTWLRRDNRLSGLDGLRDEEGRSIAFATRAESDQLFARALCTLALAFVGQAAEQQGKTAPENLDREVIADLEMVAMGPIIVTRLTANDEPEDERVKALAKLEGAAPEGRYDRASTASFQRAVIRSEGVLTRIMHRLTTEFVLLALVDGKQFQRRRVLTMAWVEHSEDRQQFVPWLTTRMGWSSVPYGYRTTKLESARSYHLEMCAPSDDVEIEWAALAVNGRCRDKDEKGPAHLSFPLYRYSAEKDPLPDAGKVELNPVARLVMRTARSGFLRLALFTCALSFLLLLIGRCYLDNFVDNAESAATLLLFVPGLLSLYVVRPGEHGLVSVLFSGIRVMVVTAAVCVLAGGVLLILDIDPVQREQLWTGLLIAAGLATLAVLVSNFSPASHPPAVHDRVEWDITRTKAPRLRPLRAIVLYLAIVGGCIISPLAWSLDQLSVEGRLRGAIERRQAAARATGTAQRLSLSEFAHVKWTQMYVFKPPSSRRRLENAIGADIVAAGIKPPHLAWAAEHTLVVLVNRAAEVPAVATVMTLHASDARFTDDAAHPNQCYLARTDVLIVDRDATLDVQTPTACPQE